jgi:hypothetical protein
MAFFTLRERAELSSSADVKIPCVSVRPYRFAFKPPQSAWLPIACGCLGAALVLAFSIQTPFSAAAV